MPKRVKIPREIIVWCPSDGKYTSGPTRRLLHPDFYDKAGENGAEVKILYEGEQFDANVVFSHDNHNEILRILNADHEDLADGEVWVPPTRRQPLAPAKENNKTQKRKMDKESGGVAKKKRGKENRREKNHNENEQTRGKGTAKKKGTTKKGATVLAAATPKQRDQPEEQPDTERERAAPTPEVQPDTERERATPTPEVQPDTERERATPTPEVQPDTERERATPSPEVQREMAAEHLTEDVNLGEADTSLFGIGRLISETMETTLSFRSLLSLDTTETAPESSTSFQTPAFQSTPSSSLQTSSRSRTPSPLPPRSPLSSPQRSPPTSSPSQSPSHRSAPMSMEERISKNERDIQEILRILKNLQNGAATPITHTPARPRTAPKRRVQTTDHRRYMLSNEELEHSYLDAGRTNTPLFALHCARQMFTEGEFLRCNVNGTMGRQKLDEVRMDKIKEYTAKYFNLNTSHKLKMAWKACCDSINTWARTVRAQHGRIG
ncbi:PREDICTED: flocculation protein FLO11-like [Branchiostoma belcheri]|uniref:Flocculation protein FLO11-like n=1 Tax=Branchiostoma belcheri TaxID=7741 RepID=A0A6P4ZDU1_BRABE|nr:PREDICTED: flocculation protein FLO11-like [Branchiostoma belcheri]